MPSVSGRPRSRQPSAAGSRRSPEPCRRRPWSSCGQQDAGVKAADGRYHSKKRDRPHPAITALYLFGLIVSAELATRVDPKELIALAADTHLSGSMALLTLPLLLQAPAAPPANPAVRVLLARAQLSSVLQ